MSGLVLISLLNQVTLFGEDSGAAAITIMAMSPPAQVSNKDKNKSNIYIYISTKIYKKKLFFYYLFLSFCIYYY